MALEKATRPTMYFIGVTTGKSSIMRVFPKWVEALGIDAVMRGIDLPIHAAPERYREVVAFIKNDPLSLGALVTTHKIDLYHAAGDLFEYLDPYALQFGELSSISKGKDGSLLGHAKDPITCGMAMEEFVPKEYWRNNPEAGVMIMGAGGSAISMCAYYLNRRFSGNQPSRIAVCNRSEPRLAELKRICGKMDSGAVRMEYHLTPETGQNDGVLHTMPAGSLIINATGLGKDRPGSPLTDGAVFPENAMVWEINYRGELNFMHQAERQKDARNLNIQNGWMYFVYGWTQVMAEVFHREILGETLHRLSDIAAAL